VTVGFGDQVVDRLEEGWSIALTCSREVLPLPPTKEHPMNRAAIMSVTVTLAALGIALADEFDAVITKVDQGKVSFTKMNLDLKKKTIEKGEVATLPASADVKVVKAKFDEATKKSTAGDPIEGGLKNELFKIDAEKKSDVKPFGGSLYATIITDKENKKITEIRVRGGDFMFKKKKADKK
jgi:hypothetical protein